MQDLRKAKRYHLSAPVHLTWLHVDGKRLQLAGITRDISMKGIFFLTGAAIHIGTHLELDVVLPTLSGQGRGMKLHGEGTVLRVDFEGKAEKGIAARIAFEGEPEETFMACGLVQ